MVGIALGLVVPSGPGFIGIYEFFGQQTLVLLGFPADEALSFVLALHFYQYVVMALIGIPSALSIGFGRGDLKTALSGTAA